MIEQFKYETRQKDYVVCVDTLGLDSQIPEAVLDYIDQKVDFFKEKWEYKEYKMLLEDILQFIDEEHGLEAQDNYFKDQERGILSAFEAQVKEQFPGREKEAEFELTVIKCAKLIKVIQEPAYQNSLQAYLHYHLPKFREVVQIVLMLVGRPKAEISLPRSNSLDHRKCIRKDYIEKMVADLEKYELRRDSSEAVDSEYKINKLLERRTPSITQWRRSTARQSANTTPGSTPCWSSPNSSAGPGSSAGTPRSRPTKRASRPRTTGTQKS